jgi:hypothetical protein
MALTAIHPGEHLAEELKELGMSAAELARQLDVPTNRVTEILKWKTRHYRRHSPAPCPLLRYDGRILSEPAKPF